MPHLDAGAAQRARRLSRRGRRQRPERLLRHRSVAALGQPTRRRHVRASCRCLTDSFGLASLPITQSSSWSRRPSTESRGCRGFVSSVGSRSDAMSTIDELRDSYDAVVLATGADISRSLGIPGEGLPGSHHAGDFVAWYNGHPDYRDCHFDLGCGAAAVDRPWQRGARRGAHPCSRPPTNCAVPTSPRMRSRLSRRAESAKCTWSAAAGPPQAKFTRQGALGVSRSRGVRHHSGARGSRAGRFRRRVDR